MSEMRTHEDYEVKTYDGYIEILMNVKAIIKAEPICEEHKDSLLTKIDNFENVIREMLAGREEQAFQERRNDNTS
jgi:hypothetical protein